jgi:hypothetical protein
MDHSTNWDWDPGKRLIADLDSWKRTYNWIEEPHASPDGEKIAAIVRTEDELFTVCVNGTPWDSAFDRIWYLRFAPDNRLTALVSASGEWTVAVDAESWENGFEFVWNTQFSQDGKNIVVSAVHSEKRYLVLHNGIPWENGFFSMSQVTPSHDGCNVAAVVQTVPTKEKEIAKFQQGCFSVAVNGALWGRNFVNVWEPAFSHDNNHVAVSARTSLYDHTIVVDGEPWHRMFSSVWAPKFSPADGSVTGPVRIGGKWFLARNGEVIWNKGLVQLWNHQYAPDGTKIAALVAPKFGRWTVAIDGEAWRNTFGDLVTDAVFSPDGRSVACLGKDRGNWRICVDDKVWAGAYDMAWAPVFSLDGTHVAAKVEKGGRYFIVVDGVALPEPFDSVWDPVFSPDSKKIMVRGIGTGDDTAKYCRAVLTIAQ